MTVGHRVEQSRRSSVGMRAVSVHDGILYLNGQRLWLHGAAIHEDMQGSGAALSDGDIDTIVSELRSVGANVTRAHYLLSPRLLDALDAAGIMVWAQPPVDHADSRLRTPAGRNRALSMLASTLLGDRNHASVDLRLGRQRALADARLEARHARLPDPGDRARPPPRPGLAGRARHLLLSGVPGAEAVLEGRRARDRELLRLVQGPGGSLEQRTSTSSSRSCSRRISATPSRRWRSPSSAQKGCTAARRRRRGRYEFQSDYLKRTLRRRRPAAVHERRDLLDAARVRGPAGLDWRRDPAAGLRARRDPPQGPDQPTTGPPKPAYSMAESLFPQQPRFVH